jgi:hypothetical protein
MSFAATGAAIAGSVVSAALSDDNGAEGANDAAAANTRTQTQIASDQWDRYKKTYAPLEEQYVDESQTYDSADNYAKAASEASATVSSQFGKARDRLTRQAGVDPSSGAYQSNMMGLNLAQAASDVTQQNLARKNIKDMAYARRTDALSLGKGLPAQASSGLASATAANLSMARSGQAQANTEAAGWGKLVSTGVNSWLGGSKTPTTPTNGNLTPLPAWNPGGADYADFHFDP